MKFLAGVVNTLASGYWRLKVLIVWGALTALFVGCSLSGWAQAPEEKAATGPTPRTAEESADLSLPPVDLKSLPRNLFVDQENFWSTPFHMSQSDWQWTVPLAFVGAGLLASDTAIEKHVPQSSTTASHAVTASNAGVAALAGVGAGMFLWGHVTHDDQQRETGLLAGEAALDAYMDTEVFKYAFGRERPFAGDDKGRFFQGGSSFPSVHAAVSWSIASVIAHEYPGPLTEFLAYGTAGGVSAARLIGHQHFATDVLVGSALGWYLGRQVFRSHSHYSDAEIAKWGTFSKSEQEDTAHEPKNMGSPYVPMDSWIYPAMDRLMGLGYIQSEDLGMRPWTRMECARLLHQEADKRMQDDSEIDDGIQRTYSALAAEFNDELSRLDGGVNLGVSLDSIYTRFTGISGTPLRDGFDFGQTIINDYGRPYAAGFNDVTGFSSHAVAGPLSFYLRTEYQHAPSGPGLSTSATQSIQSEEGLPSAPPDTPFATVNKLDLLEGYVGMQLNNWQFTFGKQALWWGPDAGGPMLFSTNAAPILMLQINRVQPFKLPLLGQTRLSYIVGRLSGYHWVYGVNTNFVGSWTETLSDQPFIVGEKISLKPSPNLELGFSITALFGGPGVPATLHKLLQAGFSNANGAPGTSGDPGDRRGGFDFAYNMPRLAGLTFYADAFTDDEPNPWLAWNKTALTSGLYLPRVPGISRLDFRVEGVYTDAPGGGATVEHGFFYDNDRFRSGYTNERNLIGSWIGREGQGAQAWATYWFGAKSKVQLNFRHQKVSSQFIQYGGTLADIGLAGNYQLRSNLSLSASLQHERWLFPVIQPNLSHNVTAAVEILFEPQKLFRYSRHAGSQP